MNRTRKRIYHYNQWRLRIAKMLKPSRAEYSSWEIRISNSSPKKHLIFKYLHPRTILISLTSLPYTSKYVFKYMEIWNYCAFKDHQIIEWLGLGGTLKIIQFQLFAGLQRWMKMSQLENNFEQKTKPTLNKKPKLSWHQHREFMALPIKRLSHSRATSLWRQLLTALYVLSKERPSPTHLQTLNVGSLVRAFGSWSIAWKKKKNILQVSGS